MELVPVTNQALGGLFASSFNGINVLLPLSRWDQRARRGKSVARSDSAESNLLKSLHLAAGNTPSSAEEILWAARAEVWIMCKTAFGPVIHLSFVNSSSKMIHRELSDERVSLPQHRPQSGGVTPASFPGLSQLCQTRRMLTDMPARV